MTTILHFRCSPRGGAAFSSRMAEEVLARLRHHHKGAEIVFRDLSAQPPPLVDAGFSAAILGPPGEVPPELVASETLIRELEAADLLVIATPMHNYCVPAVLKAWVDQIVRIHRTFASTPGGKVGKLRDRPAWLDVTPRRRRKTPVLDRRRPDQNVAGGFGGDAFAQKAERKHRTNAGQFDPLNAAPNRTHRPDQLRLAMGIEPVT